jgi:hypothetical protein
MGINCSCALDSRDEHIAHGAACHKRPLAIGALAVIAGVGAVGVGRDSHVAHTHVSTCHVNVSDMSERRL